MHFQRRKQAGARNRLRPHWKARPPPRSGEALVAVALQPTELRTHNPRRVASATPESPEFTPRSVPQIPLFVRHLVPVQKRPVFLLERLRAVMLPLLANVILHFAKLRLADRECRITILPAKTTVIGEVVFDPSRRSTLDALEGFAHGDDGELANEDVDVIIYAPNQQWFELVLSRYTPQVSPETLLLVRRNPGLAMFGAEDDVIMQAREGVGHLALQSVIG